ncbi:MAG TPA: ketoacyl-ACP synthase III [Spirochaetaceae bacterium]|jgi:3-oxoacyl-[acyl-carrier-protein] synthase-3|nr:ketoacyl-ACP synthase III [Spirochaetaceae bacterium]
MAKAKILGTGLYAPGKAITNDELKKLAGIEFDADRLEAKIGIKARHIARLRGIDETSADFAEQAARAALADAGVDPLELDLVVVGSDTPEFISPATAILVQGRLQGGQRDCGAFDVGASCASFVTALDAAARMMAGDPSIRRAVVVGMYNMPAYVRPGDAFGWSIFADGAGAVVLGRVEDGDPSGYISGKLVADGTQWDYVGVYAGGTSKPVTKELLDSEAYGLELLQRLPGDRNLKLWPPIIRALCEKGGVALDAVKAFVLTQINKSVIEDVMDALGRPRSLAPMVMDRYGYTGSGCVPMAFHHAVKEGRIQRGDPVVFCASGAGFAVGANLLIY